MLLLWTLIREGVRYLIVVLAALVTASLFIWTLFPSANECTGCTVSRPTVRAACDKQFFGKAGAKELSAGAEDEFMVAYYEPTAGYEPPAATGYSGATSSARSVAGPGYVIVRAQPQFGFDTPKGWAVIDTAKTRPETSWQEVTVSVTRYVNPVRNDPICMENAARFRAGKFESYCEFPRIFAADNGSSSYRVFVRNESSVPIEYCLVSNCDASTPYGLGLLCEIEQASDAAEPQTLLPPHDRTQGRDGPVPLNAAPATAPASANSPDASKAPLPAAEPNKPNAPVPVRQAPTMEKPSLPELDQPLN